MAFPAVDRHVATREGIVGSVMIERGPVNELGPLADTVTLLAIGAEFSFVKILMATPAFGPQAEKALFSSSTLGDGLPDIRDPMALATFNLGVGFFQTVARGFVIEGPHAVFVEPERELLALAAVLFVATFAGLFVPDHDVVVIPGTPVHSPTHLLVTIETLGVAGPLRFVMALYAELLTDEFRVDARQRQDTVEFLRCLGGNCPCG